VSLRILIVDDDASSRKVLQRLLTREGHAAEECESAAHGLERLRSAEWDVLITDLVMPEMGGLELIGVARVHRPALRCFIMSGHLRVEGLPDDVVWIQKPLDVDWLLDALEASAPL
jgi:DNA-binding NtrC family response regulator